MPDHVVTVEIITKRRADSLSLMSKAFSDGDNASKRPQDNGDNTSKRLQDIDFESTAAKIKGEGIWARHKKDLLIVWNTCPDKHGPPARAYWMIKQTIAPAPQEPEVADIHLSAYPIHIARKFLSEIDPPVNDTRNTGLAEVAPYDEPLYIPQTRLRSNAPRHIRIPRYEETHYKSRGFKDPVPKNLG